MLTSILGPTIVEDAWQCFGFVGYPSKPVNGQTAQDSFAEELMPTFRQHVATMPSLDQETERLSFADYLKGFVQHTMKCVSATKSRYVDDEYVTDALPTNGTEHHQIGKRK